MSQLKAGFARVDITPPLGVHLVGYPTIRIADGILDPLLATAVAVSDGTNTAVMISVDVIGVDQELSDEVRDGIAELTGISRTAVFVAGTHTHLGPAVPKLYAERYKEEVTRPILQKMIGVAKMAIDDLKPEFITMYYGEDVNSEDAEAVSKTLTGNFPDAEITVINGGQPVYFYMISIE